MELRLIIKSMPCMAQSNRLQTPNYDLQTNICIEKILLAYSQFLQQFLVKQKTGAKEPFYFSGTLYSIIVHQFRYETHEKRNRCLEAYLLIGILSAVILEFINEDNTDVFERHEIEKAVAPTSVIKRYMDKTKGDVRIYNNELLRLIDSMEKKRQKLEQVFVF